MKILKLVLVITVLSLVVVNVSAQEKSTVIISYYPYGSVKYRIEIIKPNYEVEYKEIAKGENGLVFTKKEIDYWLNQNYKLSEATTNALPSTGEKFLFILIKEE